MSRILIDFELPKHLERGDGLGFLSGKIRRIIFYKIIPPSCPQHMLRQDLFDSSFAGVALLPKHQC